MDKKWDLKIKNLFSLKDKVVVVTGGAGSLGEGVARGLANFGARIVVTGRTAATLAKAVGQVREAGGEALAIVADVTDENSVQKLSEQVLAAYGRVDILVNVAGIAIRHPAEEFDIADFRKVIDANVTGTFIPCKIFGAIFKQQGYGKIVNTSSVRAFAGHPGGYAAYGTSKGAINLLTKQLATEWAKYHINVNAVAPTIFWTPLTQEVLENEKLKKIFLDRIPFGRAALVEDMVGSTVYLCSAAADFITGQIVYVDGGCTAG
ncbi:SDR family NAD(P)-dependent oxidoreductase [Sodalis ligni]|jgi:NAD(P)-dependent dehydrogenase (short-subunit alcohol dehydrogenase family)|uniref:Gluconate 5-dehydrogenase n=1 Tax=Sodalis ligni TaxID=2697027 RepID=A0A4R1N944_9GAMM|nr:SDR family oxidoreductase [Sodalis ligni]TCL03187.1 gluconate 5-dehydrogenase [Sodalis ligni]